MKARPRARQVSDQKKKLFQTCFLLGSELRPGELASWVPRVVEEGDASVSVGPCRAMPGRSTED